MILFLYNVGLLLALVLSAPWWLWQMATTRKYREGLGARLGRVPDHLLPWRRSRPAAAGIAEYGFEHGPEHGLDAAAPLPVIWLHAVSVGEVLAVSRLITELDQALPACRVMISTTTRTGQALARERFGADRVFYCPLDLPWAVNAYQAALAPVMLVLAETEFWPNLLSSSFRRGIPVIVVNGRISDRSWPRYWRLRTLWRPFLSRLRLAMAQSETDGERLRALGCREVNIAGNLKFDVRSPGDSPATLRIRDLAGELRLIVAGSTIEGEEALLLDAWRSLTVEFPDLAMVIAPRHPERFHAVAQLLQQSGFRWRLRSAIGPGDSGKKIEPGEVLLLDSIGELASVYSLATVAFVGGSLVPAGGHNPLEPAQFGVPVVIGPHYENFRPIVRALLDEDGIIDVGQTTLVSSIRWLLRDPVAAAGKGANGRRVFEQQAGATARSAAAIAAIVNGTYGGSGAPQPPPSPPRGRQ